VFAAVYRGMNCEHLFDWYSLVFSQLLVVVVQRSMPERILPLAVCLLPNQLCIPKKNNQND
jgi:hypothetical protein